MAVDPAPVELCRLGRRWRNLVPTALLLLASVVPARAQCPPTGACTISGTQSVADTLDIADRDLTLAPGARLTVTSPSYKITAGNVTLEAGAKIVGPGAAVTIASSGAIWVKSTAVSTAVIDTGVDTDGGPVSLTAAGNLTIDGSVNTHAGDGDGGDVDLLSTGGNIVLSGPEAIVGTARGIGSFGATVTVKAPAGDITVSGTIDASAGEEGGTVELDAGGVLTLAAGTGSIDVRAADPGGDGGDVTLHATSGMLLAGSIVARCAGNAAEGSGFAGSVDASSEGDIRMSGPVDLTGPPPDGFGGSLLVRANALTMTGKIDAPGKGIDGAGGYVVLQASGQLTLPAMDLSGGSTGGGRLDARSDLGISLPQEVNADGSNGGKGGIVAVKGQTVTVSGKVHASRVDALGNGGSITLHGCTLVVATAAEVSALGRLAINNLRSNGAMTVNGHVTAGGKTCLSGANRGKTCVRETDCPPPSPPSTIPPGGINCAETGVNLVEYADPGQVPVFGPGAIPTPPPVPPGGVLNVNIPPCVGPPPTTTTSTTSSSTTVTTTSSTTTFTVGTIVSTTTSTSSTTTNTIGGSTTTSSSTSSSRSTSTSTSTSTTATIPECTAGGRCDDGDFCTDDACVSGVCEHVLAQGVRAISCRLDAIGAILRAASPDDVGGAKSQTKLLGKVDAVNHLLDAAGTPGTARARRKFKRAGHQLQLLINAVVRGTNRGTIAVGIGGEMLAHAGVAKSNLLPLQRP